MFTMPNPEHLDYLETDPGKVYAQLYDVVLNNSDPLLIMANEAMIAKYDSPTAKKYPKDQINERLGPISRYGIVGVLYHKGLVKPEDAPKSIEDLVNPKFKGLLVMADPTLHVTTIQWLASLDRIMAKDKTEKFIRDLAAMKPTLVESMLPVSERVATGEIPIGLTFVKYAYSAAKSGAPLDYVRVDKMLGSGTLPPELTVALNEAFVAYNLYLRVFPDDAVVCVERARTHEMRRNYDLAIADLEHAISLQPNLEPALRDRIAKAKQMLSRKPQ